MTLGFAAVNPIDERLRYITRGAYCFQGEHQANIDRRSSKNSLEDIIDQKGRMDSTWR